MAQLPVQGKAGLPTTLTVGARSVPVVLPNAYNARTKRYRLKVFLHSYGNVGTATLNRYYASSAEAANAGSGAVVLLPSGLIDDNGQTYWNSNRACCGLDASSPADDLTFLTSLIELAISTYAIDGVEVYGYSNGAMMAHTLALCYASRIWAIYCFAGYAPYAGDSHYCTPGQKVHVTLVHGDADAVVLYPGDVDGSVLTDKPTGIYPGAVASVTAWAALNGCTGTLDAYDTANLTDTLAGAETERLAYANQASNGSVELWRVAGGSHVIGMNSNFYRAIELRGYNCRRI